MPIFGAGLHILVALFFAVHVVRTRRELYWLVLLFGFPLLGNIVYFFAVFLPQSRLERSLGKAGAIVLEKTDPGRGLRNTHPMYSAEKVGLLLARAYAAAGLHAQAGSEFASVVEQFASLEARVEYALWAFAQREQALANAHIKELNHSRKHMSKQARSQHAEMFNRLDAAVAQQVC